MLENLVVSELDVTLIRLTASLLPGNLYCFKLALLYPYWCLLGCHSSGESNGSKWLCITFTQE
jgi:hypothetical protein